MGRIIKTDIPYKKAVVLVMKHLGKQYTFSKALAVSLLDVDDNGKYLVGQGDVTYAINIDIPALAGDDAELHEVPISVLGTSRDEEAQALMKCAENLSNFAEGHGDLAADIRRDADRKAAELDVTITKFHRKEDNAKPEFIETKEDTKEEMEGEADM